MGHKELVIKDYGEEMLPDGRQNLALGLRNRKRITNRNETMDFVGNFKSAEDLMSFFEDTEEEASNRGLSISWITQGPAIDIDVTDATGIVAKRRSRVFGSEVGGYQWRRVK